MTKNIDIIINKYGEHYTVQLSGLDEECERELEKEVEVEEEVEK